MTQDDTRANFLAALSRAEGVKLSSFESSFVASNLSSFNFSRKQRIAIDRMMAKYADQIKFYPERGPSLAARAAAEEERLAQENRRNPRIVVGGKVMIRPAISSGIARARKPQ